MWDRYYSEQTPGEILGGAGSERISGMVLNGLQTNLAWGMHEPAFEAGLEGIGP